MHRLLHDILQFDSLPEAIVLFYIQPDVEHSGCQVSYIFLYIPIFGRQSYIFLYIPIFGR